MSWLFALFVLALLSVAMVVTVSLLRRRRLTPRMRRYYRRQWQDVAALADPARQLIAAESVFDALLAALGYRGSFADKLKAAGPRFSNTEELWQAHKLRNRVAHEVGFSPSDAESRRAVAAFERALRMFIQ